MKTKMKHPLTALAMSFALLGCDQPKQTGEVVSTNAMPQEVKKEVKEAMDATAVYVAQNKDQFVASMQEKLTKLDQQIAALGTRSETLKDDRKAEMSKAVGALRDQRAELEKKFEALKISSKDAWNDMKAGFEAAFGDLEKAYENAKSKFSN